MDQGGNKNVVGSVLFLDIVDYSKKPVSEEIVLKNRFNALIAEALRDVPPTSIILDTGDGAAITFLGNVEDAIKTVLAFREKLLADVAASGAPLPVRMGINLGPVCVVRDINDRANVIGDGINVAQRIMSFADAGQILVSRSYYEAVSRLSHDYSNMFHRLGSRRDKHVREHEVYVVADPGELAQMAAAAAVVRRRMWGWGGAAVAGLALVIGIGIKIAHRAEAPAPAASDAQTAQAAAPQDAPAASAVAAALPAKPSKKSHTDAETAHKKEHHKDRVASSKPESGGKAQVLISATPWGEVFLDGKSQGVSPPLRALQVSAGDHVVEIRNSTFPAYKQALHIKAGAKISIVHKFD
jgi:class 3 adenylate cyclase